MAKSKHNSRDRRGTNVASSPRLHVSPSPRGKFAATSYWYSPPKKPVYSPRGGYARPAIADNRFYHPLGGLRPVMTYSGTPSVINRLHDAPRRLNEAVHSIKRSMPHVVAKKALQARLAQINRFGPNLDRQTRAIRAFSDPLRIPLCHARRIRREVIHALKIAGTGVGKPHRNANSEIKC